MKNITRIILMIIVPLAIIALIFLYFYNRDDSNRHLSLGVFESQSVWEYKTSEAITSTPVWDGLGQIYLHTSNSVMAISALDGKLLWKASSPSKTPLSAPPLISGSYLIVPEEGSRIAVFIKDTGQLLWRSPVIEIARTHAVTANIESMAATTEMIYITRFDWTITAYRLNNGEIIWEDDLPGRTSPYVVTDGRYVYLGVGPLLKTYDGKTGALLWQKEIFGYIGPMTNVEKTLYIVDEENSSLLSLDIPSKNITWKEYYVGIDDFEFGCLIVREDSIYIAAEEIVKVSKNNGKIEWSSEKIGRLECPVVLNNILYVRNTNNLLFAFDISTGKIVETLKLDFNYTPMKHEPNRGPLATNRLLIVPINEYEVIAYKPNE